MARELSTDDERTRKGGRAPLDRFGDANPARLPGVSRFKRSGPHYLAETDERAEHRQNSAQFNEKE